MVEVTDEGDRFVATVDGVEAGHVTYVVRDGRIVFRHTEVDSAYGGRGIGGALARAGLDAARDHRLAVVPLCPFVKAWIDKHPDYQDLVST